MDIKIIRTDSDNPDFVKLVKFLDADLAERDGNDHSFYSQFNKIDKIKYVAVAYENDQAIGCGAIKEFAPGVMEVKRMYTLPECRGKGIAAMVLAEWKYGRRKCCTINVYWKRGKDNRKRLRFTRRADTKSFLTMGNMRE